MKSTPIFLVALSILTATALVGAGCGQKKENQPATPENRTPTTSVTSPTAPSTPPATSGSDTAITLEHTPGVSYTVDPHRSLIRWQGKSTRGQTHTGTVRLASGTFGMPEKATGGDLKFSGKIEIDMRSFTVEGTTTTSTLEKQLKGSGYLNTTKFPTSTFEITDIYSNDPSMAPATRYVIDGRIILQGKSKTVHVPVTMNRTGNELHITGHVTTDQKGWATWSTGVPKAVGNTIDLDIDVIATKKS